MAEEQRRRSSRDGMLPYTIPRCEPLLEGRLIGRYKRFLADIELDVGGVITAHCVNTGRMEGLTRPGLRVWVSRAPNPNRKLKYTWELTETEDGLIGTNTSLPNRIVRHLLEGRALSWLSHWDELVPEKPYGTASRIDFWMRRGRRETYLEVKNCHLVYPDRRAYFPDTCSVRASSHLKELMEVRKRGCRAHVLFFCQIPGVKAARPSDVHDPDFARNARQARTEGVTFSALAISQTPDSITVDRRIPVDLKPYRTERVARWMAANRKTR